MRSAQISTPIVVVSREHADASGRIGSFIGNQLPVSRTGDAKREYISFADGPAFDKLMRALSAAPYFQS